MLRGIAILIVVIGHAIQANLLEGDDCFLWSKIILAFQMPLLFLISGYAAGFSFPSKTPLRFIRKKFVRLFVPYLCWEIIHYFLVAVQPNEYRDLSLKTFLQEILVSDFWFLRMLFLFFVLVWICNEIICFLGKADKTVFSIVLLVVSLLCMPLIAKIPFLSKSGSTWYYLWFVLGYISFHVLKDVHIKSLWVNRRIRIVIFVVSAAAMSVMALILLHHSVSSKLVAVVFSLGVCGLICSVDFYIPSTLKKAVGELGRNTLPIYAIHWCLLFSPLFRLGVYTHIFSAFPLWVSSTLTTITWIAVCVLVMKIFRKMKITRNVLLGEK